MNPLKQYLSMGMAKQRAVEALYRAANKLSHHNAVEDKQWREELVESKRARESFELARKEVCRLAIPQEVVDAVMENQLV